MPITLRTFFTLLLCFFGEIFFIDNYNIGFEAEALERQNGDDDGEDGDDGGDGAGDGEATGGEDGADEGGEEGGATGGAAGAEGDEAGNEADAFEVGGVLGFFLVPEENDEADKDALEGGEGEDGEPVEEGLAYAEDGEEAIGDDAESFGEAEGGHEFEFGGAGGKKIN